MKHPVMQGGAFKRQICLKPWAAPQLDEALALAEPMALKVFPMLLHRGHGSPSSTQCARRQLRNSMALPDP